MKTIGLLSDTHNHLDDKFYNFMESCDMIWHAGDIGSIALADKIAKFKPLIAVSGNIDDYQTHLVYPLEQRFTVEEVDVYMTHIGGYPGKYSAAAGKVLRTNPPKIFVCGHSHILRVMFDEKFNCLVMNPGAAGQYGQQPKRTVLRFKLHQGEVKDLEICELPR